MRLKSIPKIIFFGVILWLSYLIFLILFRQIHIWNNKTGEFDTVLIYIYEPSQSMFVITLTLLLTAFLFKDVKNDFSPYGFISGAIFLIVCLISNNLGIWSDPFPKLLLEDSTPIFIPVPFITFTIGFLIDRKRKDYPVFLSKNEKKHLNWVEAIALGFAISCIFTLIPEIIGTFLIGLRKFLGLPGFVGSFMGIVTCVFSILFFLPTKSRFVFHGIIIGIIWSFMSLLLIILFYPTYREFMLIPEVIYFKIFSLLAIPIITIGIGFILELKLSSLTE